MRLKSHSAKSLLRNLNQCSCTKMFQRATKYGRHFPAFVPMLLAAFYTHTAECLIYPRGGSFGYLAAVAMPLDLPNREVYVAFNFEANYGLPANDTYKDWINRWNLDKYFLGIGNNVTYINGRKMLYTRSSFYRSIVGYMEHFGMNGTACLLRTICEIAESTVDVNNGLLGSIFKILFMPSTSSVEDKADINSVHYEAERWGSNVGDCLQYTTWCPVGPLNLISKWL